MLPHQPQNPFLMNRQLLHKPQMRPDAAVTPEWMLGLERLNARDEFCITLGHPA
jgi:hypothetical protein